MSVQADRGIGEME